MTTLAAAPPAAVCAGHLLAWSSITNMSLAAKTICASAYTLVLYKVVFKFFTAPLRHLPVPGGDSFLFGHGFPWIRQLPLGTLILKWIQEVPNEGLISFRTFFHLGDCLIATSPEAVMEIVNNHSYDWAKAAPTRNVLTRIIGNGLVIAEGNEHKQQRRNLTPAFSGKAIRELVPLFWHKALSFVEAFERESGHNNGVVEISALVSRPTLDIIGLAGLGKDFSTTENDGHELAEHYSIMLDPKKGYLFRYALLNTFFPPWFVRLLPLKTNRVMDNATSNVRRITKELLAEKDRAMRENSVEQKDIIALLMRTEKFSDDGLTDQLLTFLAAG